MWRVRCSKRGRKLLPGWDRDSRCQVTDPRPLEESSFYVCLWALSPPLLLTIAHTTALHHQHNHSWYLGLIGCQRGELFLHMQLAGIYSSRSF